MEQGELLDRPPALANTKVCSAAGLRCCAMLLDVYAAPALSVVLLLLLLCEQEKIVARERRKLKNERSLEPIIVQVLPLQQTLMYTRPFAHTGSRHAMRRAYTKQLWHTESAMPIRMLSMPSCRFRSCAYLIYFFTVRYVAQYTCPQISTPPHGINLFCNLT